MKATRRGATPGFETERGSTLVKPAVLYPIAAPNTRLRAKELLGEYLLGAPINREPVATRARPLGRAGEKFRLDGAAR